MFTSRYIDEPRQYSGFTKQDLILGSVSGVIAFIILLPIMGIIGVVAGGLFSKWFTRRNKRGHLKRWIYWHFPLPQWYLSFLIKSHNRFFI